MGESELWPLPSAVFFLLLVAASGALMYSAFMLYKKKDPGLLVNIGLVALGAIMGVQLLGRMFKRDILFKSAKPIRAAEMAEAAAAASSKFLSDVFEYDNV
jgi:hypothetical protein